MKKDKWPTPPNELASAEACKWLKQHSQDPDVSLAVLEASTEYIAVTTKEDAPFSPEEALETIIMDLHISSNVEQEWAIRRVCEHFINGTKEKMLCHIAGPSGTDKSHVIRAIVKFFKHCSASQALMLSTSMGCATILMGGYTLNALTFLGPHKTYT